MKTITTAETFSEVFDITTEAPALSPEAQKVVDEAKAILAAQAAEVVKTFTPAEIVPFKVEKMTIGEFLDMENLAFPVYQRSEAWKAEQIAGLIATIMNGDPIPAVILGHLPADKSTDGLETDSLIDGKQRTTVIRGMVKRFYDMKDGLTDYDSAALDYVLNYELPVMTVELKDEDHGRRLFGCYNNGTALSVFQRNKSKLSTEILLKVQPYIDEFVTAFPGKGCKLGKTSPETAAMMLAAAMAKPATACTSSGPASKVLIDAVDVPAYPADVMAAIVAACQLEGVDKDAILSPSRLIPLVLSSIENEATAEQITAAIIGYNTFRLSATKVKTVWVSGRGEKAKTVKAPIAAVKIFGDTANSPKATAFRKQAFDHLFSTPERAAINAAELAIAAEVAAAIEGLGE